MKRIPRYRYCSPDFFYKNVDESPADTVTLRVNNHVDLDIDWDTLPYLVAKLVELIKYKAEWSYKTARSAEQEMPLYHSDCGHMTYREK